MPYPMEETCKKLRIFIGTDRYMYKAEKVLEYSIRKHASLPVEITWMRAGDPEWQWAGVPEKPYDSSELWATPFTCFRFAIPELAGFDGYAIYNDVDQCYLEDPAKLLALGRRGKWLSWGMRDDVSVVDCGAFKDKDWWPSLAEMKSSQHRIYDYRKLIEDHDLADRSLPRFWNQCDDYATGQTCLLHWTNMRTQPWKPFPNAFNYPDKHPNPDVQRIWDEYEAEYLGS